MTNVNGLFECQVKQLMHEAYEDKKNRLGSLLED